MKRLLLATTAALLALTSAAHANLVEIGATNALSFVDVGAQGFGAAPRVLTEQTNGFETGKVAPGAGGSVVTTGDAIAGSNKASTPSLGFLGWQSGADVAIGFNSDQTGNSGVTLQLLTLTIYSGTTAIGSFSTASPINYSVSDLALQQGNGNAEFIFVLDTAQRAQFDALNPTTSMTIGLLATLGCAMGAPASCLPTNDGPDSFNALASQGSPAQSAVPIPGAAWLFGTGLAGIALASRRRQKPSRMA